MARSPTRRHGSSRPATPSRSPAAAALRRARWGEARRGPGPLRHRRPRPAGARRRRVDGWLHRLPARPRRRPRRGPRRRPRPAPPPLRDDARVTVLERTNVADGDRRRRSAVGSTPSSPTCRSSRCATVIPVLVTLVPAWVSDGPAGEAAVRGRSCRGQPRSRRHHRPGRPRPGPRRGRSGARRRRLRRRGWMDSPLLGAQGNRELFVHAVTARRRDAPSPFVAHHERDRRRRVCPDAVAWLADRGHEAWIVPDDADVLGLDDLSSERPVADADLVVSPRRRRHDAARRRHARRRRRAVARRQPGPTRLPHRDRSARAHRRPRPLPRRRGRWPLAPRRTHDAAHRRAPGRSRRRWRALNEVVVEKHEAGHTVRLLAHRRRAVHELRRRRTHRRHAYRLDGLLACRPEGRSCRRATGRCCSRRCRRTCCSTARWCSIRPRRSSIEVAGSAAPSWPSTASSSDARRPATSCAAGRRRDGRFVRSPHHFHQILKAKFGLADR